MECLQVYSSQAMDLILQVGFVLVNNKKWNLIKQMHGEGEGESLVEGIRDELHASHC